MSGEKKDHPSVTSPIEWIFRASLLLFGAVIALNLAVAFLQPILPWILGGLAVVSVVWLTVAIVRWRRSRW
jgi:membrane protein YdbS with pleckstrin-like domain